MIFKGIDSSLNQPTVLFRPGNPAFLSKNVPWMSAPAVARTKGGRLYLTFNTGADDPISNMLTLSMSDDDGKTWEECVYAFIAFENVRLHEPLVWADPEGQVYVSFIQSCGVWDGRGGLWISRILGEDSAHPVMEEPHRVCNGVMANDPFFDEDGTWLLPISRWNWDSPCYNDPVLRYSGIYRSLDYGLTADLIGLADVPNRTFDENSLVRLSDGRLLMIVRTDYGWGKTYSSDNGRTWTPGVPFRYGPSAKSVLRVLPNGHLLWLGYDTDRPVRERIAAFLSEDGGETWPYHLLLDGRENVSYPNAHIMQDGTIYAVHDFDRKGAKESVLHRFTEEDIKTGMLVSPGSFLGRIAFR